MRNPFAKRPLTRGRVALAIAIAGLTDAVQIGLGPLGWTFFDEIADVAAMILISLLIGFHPLLLPTFLVEIFPVVDMLPTWTGCVGAVILWRKGTNSVEPKDAASSTPQSQPDQSDPKSGEPKGPVIDV